MLTLFGYCDSDQGHTQDFLSVGADFAHLLRGLPYTERNSPAKSNTMLKKTLSFPDGAIMGKLLISHLVT